MLVLSRRPGESFVIDLADAQDTEITAAEMFANGPVIITLIRGHAGLTRIGIKAPRSLRIMREELYERDSMDWRDEGGTGE